MINWLKSKSNLPNWLVILLAIGTAGLVIEWSLILLLAWGMR